MTPGENRVRIGLSVISTEERRNKITHNITSTLATIIPERPMLSPVGIIAVGATRSCREDHFLGEH